MNIAPTFNLLSIGHRGVGKTVFLAGSYTELHGDYQTKQRQKMWFDCTERKVQENIDSIIGYISETAHYPPATMKISNFNFCLNRRSWRGTETVCNFSWSDIPGEICTIHNSDFRAMVSNSDGCCVFIDAYALVCRGKAYIELLEEIIKQVMAIASVAYLHDRYYPFVLIMTKCDLLKSDRLSKDLEELLQPLTSRLDAVKAQYQIFYSMIPIVRAQNTAKLDPKGAAAPILSLVLQLAQAEQLNLVQDKSPLFTSLWSNLKQNLQNLIDQLLQKQQVTTSSSRVEVSSQAIQVKSRKQSNQQLVKNLSQPKNIIAVAVAGMAVVGISLAYRYTKLSQPCLSGNCLLLEKAGASDSYSTKTYKKTKVKAGASDSYSTKTYKNTETDEE